MAKQRHLTPDQVIMQAKIDAYVKKEVQRNLESVSMDQRVINGIRAAYIASLTLYFMVLIDFYGASKEWCNEILQEMDELLQQYNDGTVQLKQMVEHIKIKTGIDVEKFADREMDLVDVKEYTESEEVARQ